MGQQVPNLEVVSDYSTEKNYVRLHMDIPLSKNVLKRIIALIEEEQYSSVLDILKSNTPTANHEFVTACCNAFTTIRKGKIKAA